jgi:hypothetical protein
MAFLIQLQGIETGNRRIVSVFVKKEKTTTHSQGCNKTINRTADSESTFSQLSIDIGGFDMVSELEINAGEESQEPRSLMILGVIPNTLQDLLDNNVARSNVLSLSKAHFQDLSFA